MYVHRYRKLHKTLRCGARLTLIGGTVAKINETKTTNLGTYIRTTGSMYMFLDCCMYVDAKLKLQMRAYVDYEVHAILK